MKLPEFNMNEAKWDYFRAFYIRRGPGYDYNNQPIVQFDTGEVIVTKSRWEPDIRKTYEQWNVGVYATTDDYTSLKLCVPGTEKPLPKAWLSRDGLQTLWVDYDHKLAVRIDKKIAADTMKRIPERFRSSVNVYYGGKDDTPLGAPIEVSRPKKHHPSLVDHCEGIKAACAVWKTHNEKFVVSRGALGFVEHDRFLAAFKARDMDHYTDIEFRNLNDNERMLIHNLGIPNGFDSEYHEFLNLKGD